MNFMGRVMVCFVLILLFVNFVIAEGWDSFEREIDSPVVSEDLGVDIDSDFGESIDSSLGISSGEDSLSDGTSSVYTQNFYFALGVGGVGLLIVLLFLYLFFRGPKNRWKNRK